LRALCLAICGMAPLGVLAQEIAPNDFAYGVTAIVPGEAAAYRAPLPLIVYQKSSRTDLGDLRVFNQAGQVVPHRLERPRTVVAIVAESTKLPLFPIRGDSPESINALRVTIESGGTRVDAHTDGKSSSNGSRVRSYVADARGLNAGVAAFKLQWMHSQSDYAGRVRVEASEDLGNWRVVHDGAPIAYLRSGDRWLMEQRVELPGVRAKFWRLSWLGEPPPFEIFGLIAEPTNAFVDVTRQTLAIPGTPVSGKPGEFEFDLGASLPLDRLNLELSEPNTLIEAQLLSRATPSEPWNLLTRGGFYRLRNASANTQELTNGDLVVELTTNRYWLMRIPAGAEGLGTSVPKLRIGWLPHEVVFFARGSAPFTLAFGSAAAPRFVGAFASIPEGTAVLRASFSEPKTLGGESRLQPVAPAKAFPVKSVALWSVLLAGVALLGWMAYRLSRDLKSSATPGA
jgi:hypothetical protein